MPENKTQETLTVWTNEESQNANGHMDLSSIGFYSQTAEIQRADHQCNI